jgi:prolyl 4-hydroxylase
MRFLVDAANWGGAEAPARLAALAAAGIFREVSGLTGALECLVVAAERGWVSAQEQLLAMRENRELTGRTEIAAAPTDWRALASGIDLANWTRSPGARILSESPRIASFDDFIPESVCTWVIDRSRSRLGRAMVYDAVGGQELADHSRNNSAAQFDLADTEFLQILIQLKMAAACQLPQCNFEAPSVLHYAVGERITNHFDFVNPAIPNYEEELQRNGQRILTFLIYLNQSYDAGKTVFPRLGVTHSGKAGQGLFFVNALPDGSPDQRTVHAGEAPENGEKWIITQFVRNRRVLPD